MFVSAGKSLRGRAGWINPPAWDRTGGIIFYDGVKIKGEKIFNRHEQINSKMLSKIRVSAQKRQVLSLR